MLKIVPKTEPPEKEKVRQRVKRMVRPDGMLQCNRCGSRLVLNATAGVVIKNGRKTGGTVIEKDVCGDCWKQGIYSPMMPPLQRVK